MFGQIEMLEPGQIEEGLVDGVYLEITCIRFGRGQHAALHVGIERVVGRADRDTVALHLVLYEMDGIAHLDAERLGFRRHGNGAAIVVRQDNGRHVAQRKIHDALGRDVERVAIAQGYRTAHRYLRASATTTPHNSTYSSTSVCS